jgi:hypothetical protein
MHKGKTIDEMHATNARSNENRSELAARLFVCKAAGDKIARA